jgi:hypothetical protein
MKKNMKTLSAIALSGLLLGLTATPAFATDHDHDAKTDGHEDHGCKGGDKASCNGKKGDKASCSGKDEKKSDKASCGGKDGCGAKGK